MWPVRKLKHVALAERLDVIRLDRDQVARERDLVTEELEGEIELSEGARRMLRRVQADRDALVEWLILHGESREHIEAFLDGIRKNPMESPLP